jgi:hypothetical protein
MGYLKTSWSQAAAMSNDAIGKSPATTPTLEQVEDDVREELSRIE